MTPSPNNVLVTASFGHLIPDSLLSRFEPLNTLNVHPSLLPQYRGAAPIQWTIINGDSLTGVTVQELSRGRFDRGRILAQDEYVSAYSGSSRKSAKVRNSQRIPPESLESVTFRSLEVTLGERGANLLLSVLRDFRTAQASCELLYGIVPKSDLL